mmetsp:Transcript_25323/g.80493  ORF Transcript_25323/g.80493 Transcript_25323/m.80493 type:complete len:535 (-) Transcript_25323:420-2024(-)
MDVLCLCHAFRQRCLLLHAHLLNIRFEICLGALLLCDRLGVCGTLCCRVSGEGFILHLGILLAHSPLLDLLIQVGLEHVQQGNDASVLLALRLVGVPGLWRRRRRGALLAGESRGNVRRDLGEDRNVLRVDDSGSGNATRSGGGRSRSAHVHQDTVLGGELPLRWGLVRLRGVKLCQAADRNLNELLGGTVCSQKVCVLVVFLLPELRCLCNLLVQRLDAVHKASDVLCKRRNGPLCLLNGRLEVHGLLAQGLVLILRLVELRLTEGLLLFVGLLLLAEQGHHVVNHLDDFVEGASLAAQSQGDEVEAGILVPVLCPRGPDHHQRPALYLCVGDLGLQECRAWQRPLKEFKGIIIVQNIDGVCECDKLLRARLGTLLPLRLLGLATRLEIGKILLVLEESLGGVIQVRLYGLDLHADLSDTLQLRLNCLCVRLHLLRLCCGKRLKVPDGLFFCRGELGEALLHGLLHLFQDVDDLHAAGGARSLGKEGGQLVAVCRAQVHVDGEPAQGFPGGRLQEIGQAALEGGDSLPQSSDV